MLRGLPVAICIVLLIGCLGLGCAESGEGIGVPILVENAGSVGAVSFELSYDSQVLEADTVDAGPLADGADAKYAVMAPGTLLVAIQGATRLEGDGILVRARFKVLEPSGSTTLGIVVKDARDLNTGALLQVQVSDGRFAGSDTSVTPPVITFL